MIYNAIAKYFLRFSLQDILYFNNIILFRQQISTLIFLFNYKFVINVDKQDNRIRILINNMFVERRKQLK